MLQLTQGHYEAVIAGQVTAVAGDGNCLYHSLLLTLNETEQQQLFGTAFIPYDRKSVADDVGNPNVMALRQLLASHLRENPAVINDFLTKSYVTYEEVIQEDEQAKGPIAEDDALARELQVAEDAAWASELQLAQDIAWARELQVAQDIAWAREVPIAQDAALARRLEQQAVVKFLLAGV